MAYGDFCQVHQTAKHLVTVQLHKEFWNRVFSIVLFDDRIGRFREVVHNDVKKLLSFLLGEESILHFKYIGMIKFLEDFVLTVFILWVLQNLLDSYYLQSLAVATLSIYWLIPCIRRRRFHSRPPHHMSIY
jgi:hypothetical protein